MEVARRKRLKREDGAVGLGTLQDGRVTWESPHAFTRELKAMGDGQVMVRVDFATEKAVASLKAVRYYRHALGFLAKETENDKDELHKFYRGKFLTETAFVVNRQSGEVVEEHVTKSTMDLEPDEMWDYTEKVRQHAAEFFGVIIKPPDPEYARYQRSA
jgi:hypothetical protein